MLSVKEFKTKVQERIWLEYVEKTQKKELTWGNFLILFPLLTLIWGVYENRTHHGDGGMNFLGFIVAFMSFFFLIPAMISAPNYFKFKKNSNLYYEYQKEDFFNQTFTRDRDEFIFQGRSAEDCCIFINDGYNPFFAKSISIPEFVEMFYLTPEEMKNLGELKLNNDQKSSLLNQLKASPRYHQYDLCRLYALDDEIYNRKKQIEDTNLAMNEELVSHIGLSLN